MPPPVAVAQLPEAQRPFSPAWQVHDLGCMDVVCSGCGAFHWMDEKLSASTQNNILFGTCCFSVDGSLSHVTSYTPLQSDIITAVSLAATITRVAGGWWATDFIWRTAFVAMERGGILAKGLSQAISNRPPAPRHFTRKSNMAIIYIALFATFAIDYFSAALTGSFIWETADTRVPGKIPLSGITDGTVLKEQLIKNTTGFMGNRAVDAQSRIITMASASASIAWGTPQLNSISNITEPSTTFRRVINGAQYISTNSTLAKVAMPYFVLDTFEWVRDPQQVLTDAQLSLLNQNASGHNPFIVRANGTGGLLPDHSWGIGPLSKTSEDPSMRISEMRLFALRIWFPWSSPTDPNMTTIAPPCPQNYTIDPGSEINFISGSDYPYGRDCFAIANVSYRAGVMSCQNCKIISPNIVEANFSEHPGSTGPSSLLGTAFIAGALGFAPLLAANLFLSNYAIPLNYATNRDLAIELTSRAYQATWVAMADYLTASANPTTVQIALPTLRAKVIQWRVYLWVALHLCVLALGLLFTYFQSCCDHPWVEDPTMAVFWLDTKAVLTKSDGQLVWDPWQPGTEICEDGVLILEQNEAGQRSVQVKRSSGLRQRRYSDINSMVLRRRVPPSSSMILGKEGRQCVETLIGISVPTGSSLDSTENFAE